MAMLPKNMLPKKQQAQLSGDELHALRFRDALQAAEKARQEVDVTGEKRVSIAAITASITGLLAVLGSCADALEMLKPSELEWVLTTGGVVLAAILLLLFAVVRITRLSKQESDRLRTALTALVDASYDHVTKARESR